MKNHHSALPLSSCTQNAQRGETAVPGGADKSFCMLGAGHVAWHLAPALQKAGLVPRGVWSRTEAHAAQLAGRLGTNVHHTDDMATLPQADIYICCVRDDALVALLHLLFEFSLLVQELLLYFQEFLFFDDICLLVGCVNHPKVFLFQDIPEKAVSSACPDQQAYDNEYCLKHCFCMDLNEYIVNCQL